MDRVRYGIVGIGKQGTFYTQLFTKGKAVLKGAILTCVCDIDPKRREWAKNNLKDVAVFDDYLKMFESGLIDAVIIDTPHYLHPEIAISAFNHHLNVLSDKPAGVYTKQVRQMNEEAAKHPDLAFGLMFNQRTNPLYIKAKEIIDLGKLGNITRIVWIITDWYRSKAYYSQGGWRGTWGGEGGGVLLNQCPHQLDLFTWMIGLPKTVRATLKTVGRDINVENDVTAVMQFENGATGIFITSTHDTPGTNRLEITGDGGKIVIEKGKLVFTENAEMEPSFNAHNTAFWGHPKTSSYTYKAFFRKLNIFKYPPEHLGILKNYTDYLLKRTDKLIAKGEEGIKALTLSNAIHLSGFLNEEVTIPFDEDLYYSELMKRVASEKEHTNKH